MDGTRREALEEALILAGHHRHLCIIYEDDGRNRIVEPYRLFNGRPDPRPRGRRERKRRRLLQCYQVAGAAASGERHGWKSLDLDRVTRVQELDVSFDPRGAFAETAPEPEPEAEPAAAADTAGAPNLRLTW